MPTGVNFLPRLEAAFDAQLPGKWRQISANQVRAIPAIKIAAAWELQLEEGSIALEAITRLQVVIDTDFPFSQPRVLAPQAPGIDPWPHIEDAGLICVAQTRSADDPVCRVLQHINWAIDVLRLNPDAVRREFEREFMAYWLRSLSKVQKRPDVLSLLRPRSGSREIVFVEDLTRHRVVVADTSVILTAWLKNEGHFTDRLPIGTAWLVTLRHPWVPEEFPVKGSDVLEMMSEVFPRITLTPGRRTPIIFESETSTGSVFCATLLHSGTLHRLSKGYRDISRVPQWLVISSFKSKPVLRCSVTRVDGSWVHGRDHNAQFATLRQRRVALIGCGSLGGPLIRILAQAGVGGFILVDSDELGPSNVSRHVLGMRWLGKNKAVAMRDMLAEDFPHIEQSVIGTKRFERLDQPTLDAISGADLIITAGLGFDSEMSVSKWRDELKRPPMHLCAWVEEFALAGHAIGLIDRHTIRDAFDADEKPLFRLTDWPSNIETTIVEAGCGNVFQPHGAAEIQLTISMAAGLAIEMLIGKVNQSERRSWMGDREMVSDLGGTALGGFDASLTVKVFPWP